MQVAAKHMAPKSTIIGVDLVAIKPVPGAIGIVADITTDKCRQLLKKELRHFKANVVLNDGAPNVGRDWNQDAYTQNGLVLMSLKLACEWLVPGGTFVSKVFRSRDYNSLMYVLQKLFKNVRATKPQSSRNVSAEIFVVCQGYLAPNKIDPRMLDPKFVFEDILDEKNTQKVNIFAPEKKKRQREGYADGNVGLHAKTSVGTFIASESYLDILAANNALVFEAEDRLILQHPGSTAEIKELLGDLKVLGKKEFRQLVKWRDAVKSWIGKHAKKAIDSDESEGEEDGSDGSDGEGEDEDPDATEAAEQAKLESLVDDVKERKFREKKALRRKRDKARGKAQERQALSMDHPMDFEDVIQDDQLFAIKNVKNQAGIDGMEGGETWVPEEDDAGVALPAGVNFKDHDEYGEALEDELEADYAEYKERRGMTKRKVLLGKSGNKIIGEAVDQNEDAPDTDYIPEDGGMEAEEMNGSDSEDDDAANPLIATRGDGAAAKRNAALWFSQSQFGDLDESDDDDEEDIAAMRAKAGAGAGAGADTDAGAGPSTKQSKELVANFDEIGDDPDLYDSDDTDAEEEDNFEVVSKAARAQKVDNSGNLDAEGLAIAAEMIIRKRKRELIDASYNRYAFKDDPMPDWFDEEESNHIARGVPMTKEMAVDIQKRQRELNARPIKKVLEAKARKKKKVNSQLDKLKSKATAIYENPDLSEREKNTQIQSLYNKTRIGTEDKKPQVVVARKGMGNKRPAGVKGKYIMVDGRSKTDLRAKKRQAQKMKAKRKYK